MNVQAQQLSDRKQVSDRTFASQDRLRTQSAMKTTLGYSVLVIALAVMGCQRIPSTSPVAVETATKAKEPVQSPKTNEQIESETSKQAALLADDAGGHGLLGRGPGIGRGRGGMGRGGGAKGGMRADMTTLHAMFADRDKIKRTVKNLPNGAEATTESDDETIAGLLQEHVPAMEGRVMENKPLPPMTFHPIFVELIKHADDYTLEYVGTDKGMKVTYHAEDPFVVMLVQQHAQLLSRFIKNGMGEIHKPYALPDMNGQSEVPAEPTTDKTN